MTTARESTRSDDRLDEVIAAFFDAEAAGLAPRPEDWIARHPDQAVGLAEFFRAEGRFHRLISPPAPGIFPRAFGDYTLLEEIGRGGMGVVFKAEQASLGRVVALKMIPDLAASSRDDFLRFRFEAESIAKLDHPGIIAIHDYGQVGGCPYFTMRLAPEGSLADHLGRFRDDPKSAARIVAQAAQAVHYAHDIGILHRDLKPSNILLDGDTPFVSDFGLAKSLGGISDLTRTGAILGTPAYMAPEQAIGRSRQTTTAADVYGLGTILYALLTGHAPFPDLPVATTLDQVRHREPEPPRRANARVERDLETICLKCLEKDPSRRYESAKALDDDLRRYLDGRPIEARRSGPVAHLAKWARRYPALTALAGALVVSILGGLVGVAWKWRDEARARGELEETLYASRIALADREIRANNVAQAEVLLEQCPPALRGWEWSFLRRRGASRTQPNPTGLNAFDFAYSPDGGRIAVLYEGKSVGLRLFDNSDARQLWSVDAHEPLITTLVFRPDGRQVATASFDGTAKVWDAETGGLLWSYKTDQPTPLVSLAYQPDGGRLALGGTKSILILDGETGKKISSLDEPTDRVRAIVYRPDGTRLAAACDDGMVRVWDLDLRRPPRVFPEGSLLPIMCLAYSPDGAHLAAGTLSGEVIIWDAETGRELARVYGHTDMVTRLAFDRTGRRFATGGNDRLVKIWDARTFRELLTIRGHESQILALAFRPDGSELATADTVIRRWDARPLDQRPEGEAETLRGHTGLVTGLAYSPDGSVLASCGHDRTVILRDATSGTVLQTLSGATGALSAVAFRPGSKEIAAAGRDRAILIWDSKSGLKRFALTGHRRHIPTLAYSPDGRWLASGGEDYSLNLWDAATGERLWTTDFRGFIYELAFDPSDPRRLAVALGNGSAQLLNLESRSVVRQFKGPNGRVNAVAFAPDGRVIASAGEAGVALWEASTGRRLLSLPDLKSETLSVAFSPDGRWLATGAADRIVALWDVTTGRQIAKFLDASGHVRRLAFHPDGRRLAAVGGDKTIRVWHWSDPSFDRDQPSDHK